MTSTSVSVQPPSSLPSITPDEPSRSASTDGDGSAKGGCVTFSALPDVGPPTLLHNRRRPAGAITTAAASKRSVSPTLQGTPTQRINPVQIPPPIVSVRPMGAFEQPWREAHEWMHDRLEDPNSWLNWLTLFFPVIAIQISPTRAVWISDADVMEHAYDNLMAMLEQNELIPPGSTLFPIDYTYDDMMGPLTYCGDTRAACVAWTRIMGPLRRLQAMTVYNAAALEATLASNVANGDHVAQHDEEEDEPEIIPARRPRGKQQALPKKRVRLPAPEDEEEEDEDTQ